MGAIDGRNYLTGEMAKGPFEKFYFRYKSERSTIAKELANCGEGIWIPSATIPKLLDLLLELAPAWASSDVARKEQL